MRGTAAAFILMILVCSSAGAADFALTEGSSVDLAVEHNLSLASARVQLEAKQLVSDTAWGVFVPGLSVSAGLARSNGETVLPAPGLPYHWYGSAGLGASISFSAPALQGLETARLDYLAGRISFEQARDQVTLQVRKAFYQLILFQNQLTVTRASIATAEQTFEQARTDYANGRVQRLVVRQAELSVQRAKLLLERQTVQYQNALASFKNTIGIAPEKSVELSGTIHIVPINAGELAQPVSVEKRKDIQEISARIALEESKIRTTYLGMVSPTVTLSASVSPVFPDPFNFSNPPGGGWNDRGSISLSLSSNSLLAFLPFVPQNVNLQAGNKALQSLKIQKQQLAAAAKTEIASLLRTLEASRSAIRSLEASVSLAKESYDLTKEAYGLGTADFLSLKSAEDDLLQAQYEVRSEEYTYLATLISLEYATGQSLRHQKG